MFLKWTMIRPARGQITTDKIEEAKIDYVYSTVAAEALC